MIGFTFNSIHSGTYSVIAKSVNRSLLAPLRKREITIPTRHGAYDFEDNVSDNRMITVDIARIGATYNGLRLGIRDIASWLSQTDYKELVFDDEPDKSYLSKIYGEVGLESFFRVGKATIQFECQPLAMGVLESITVSL